MTNPLQLYLNRDNTISAYRKISEQLGLDSIIFDAMNQVAQNRGFVVELLNSNASNAEKHEEVVRTLTQYYHILERRGLFFELVEELQSKLLANGHEVHANRLREIVTVKTKHNFEIRLSANCGWLIDWIIGTTEDPVHVILTSYQATWGNVVPVQIIQYLNSGLVLYTQKQYAPALVLMSIAVEATLRDVLSTKGYGDFPRTPKHIAGLSAALDIARNRENIITPSDLPTDLDEVLQAVRNKLVHLSNTSLDYELPRFAGLSPTGRFTLRDFIDNQDLVFDYVTEIPAFVDQQYVKLWKAGTHI